MRKSKKIKITYKSKLSHYNKHKRRHNNKTKTSKYKKKSKFYYSGVGGNVTLTQISSPYIPYANGGQVGEAHTQLSKLQIQGGVNAQTDIQ